MVRRTLSILALVAALAPLAGRADDWDREWEEDYTEQQPYPGGQQGDYDVSVDMNVAGGVSFDTFHGALTPYGDWVVAGGYGRVWRPHVAAGWRPYYYGRWEWTSEGWLWVSDEPFGWAAYHYGRWTYDSYYGWLWVPGYQWAPAWVAWRYSGDVVGWAPLGPGVSVYVSSYPFVDMWWTFVPCGSFVSVPVYSVAYAPTYTRRYFYATAPAPPAARGVRPAPGRPAVASPAWGGPAPRVIEQRIGRAVTPVRVVPAPAPGAARAARPGEVAIYRPDVRPAPSRDGARMQRAPGSERGALQPGEGRGSAVPAPPMRGGERAAPVAPAPQGPRGGPAMAPQAPSRAAPPAQAPARAAPAAPPPQPPSHAAPPAPQAPSRGGSRPAPGGRDPSGYAPQPGAYRGLAQTSGPAVRGGPWRGDAASGRAAVRAPPGPGAMAAPRSFAAPARGAQGFSPAARGGAAHAQQGRAIPLARGDGRGRPGRAERDPR